jgi:hypothetical protein
VFDDDVLTFYAAEFPGPVGESPPEACERFSGPVSGTFPRILIRATFLVCCAATASGTVRRARVSTGIGGILL